METRLPQKKVQGGGELSLSCSDELLLPLVHLNELRTVVGAWMAVTLYASFFCVRATLRSPSISPARGFRTEVTPLPRLHVSLRINLSMMTVHSPRACTRASRGSAAEHFDQSRRVLNFTMISDCGRALHSWHGMTTA